MDSGVLYVLYQLLRKVQAGGRGSDGAALLGEDGLVALGVGGDRRAVHVRRQRDLACAIEQGPERLAFNRQTHHHFAPATVLYNSDAAVQQLDFTAFSQRLRRSAERQPVRAAQRLDQEQLHLAARPSLAPTKSRRNHLGVVGDQQVARLQELR